MMDAPTSGHHTGQYDISARRNPGHHNNGSEPHTPMAKTPASRLRALARHAALGLFLAGLAGCAHHNAAHDKTPAAKVLPLPGAMNEFELDSPDIQVIGDLQKIRAHKEDTLSDIARRFNVGYEEIVAANPGVDPWTPGENTPVIVPTRWVLPDTPRTGIVINLAAMRLFYYPKPAPGQPQRVITHPVGIGRLEWKTPTGKTRVISKTEAPTWVPTAAIRREHEKNGDPLPASVPPGPDNPMGSHVLRLGWPEYAIHGTNKPASIGLRGTHGCLRMYPEDISALFEDVPVNTQVTVVNEPYLVGFRDGKLYLQTYPTLEEDKRNHAPRVDAMIDKAQNQKHKEGKLPDNFAINHGLVGQLVRTPNALTMQISFEATGLQDMLADVTEVKNRLPLNARWDGEGDVINQPQSASPAATPATKAPEASAAPPPKAEPDNSSFQSGVVSDI